MGPSNGPFSKYSNIYLQMMLFEIDYEHGSYRAPTYLGRNSVTIERFGARVTAPMKRTTLGCLTLFMIRT
jgi:hypothetical protein